MTMATDTRSRDPRLYTYCGKPEPTQLCEQEGYCDYHSGVMPSGVNPALALTFGCIDGPDECEGAVEYRTPLSPSGRAFPRCDKHWAERLDVQEEINERYPDSDVPPAWFDPLAAGERWEEDY